MISPLINYSGPKKGGISMGQPVAHKGRSIPDSLVEQFNKVIKRGWLPVFQREAQRIGESTAQLLAIGSRETNLENIRGDFRDGHYHGFGILQVDIGTDPDYAREWTPTNFEPGIVKGAEIYIRKFRQIGPIQGKSVHIRNIIFHGKEMGADDHRRITTAMYNNGLWPYYAYSVGKDIDSFTTGKNYGKDVYSRAMYFAALLELVQHEPQALLLEAKRQGDYCWSGFQKWAGVDETTDAKLTLPEADPPEVIEDPAPIAAQPEPKSTSPEGVTVQATKPVNTPVADSFWDKLERVKVFLVTLGTMGSGIAIAMFDKIKALPAWGLATVFGSLGLVAVTFIVMRAWRNENRERRAHELTVIQAQTAARMDQNTVTIV